MAGETEVIKEGVVTEGVEAVTEVVEEAPNAIETEEGTTEEAEDTPEEVSEEVSEESTDESTDEDTEKKEGHEDGLIVKGLTFNDMEVEGVIPEEVDTMLSEKGFDARELTEQLYADGEVSLPQETLDALYEAYGKFQVDSYISGLKHQSELLKYTTKEEQAQQEAAIKERWDGALEVVGSEEGWNTLSEWITSPESQDLVSDEDVANFNEVMATGSPYTQRLAIEAMHNKLQNSLPEEERGLEILDADTGQTNNAPSSLTSSEYHDIIASGKYEKADQKQRAMWDSQRRKGMSKGL